MTNNITISLLCSATDERCTRGFLDPQDEDNYVQRRLVPLLSQQGSFPSQQRIFPNIAFGCHGNLTKWIFRGVRGREAGVRLTTWRLIDAQNSLLTRYIRVSVAQRNTARITLDGSVFTYELISPVQVQPGDILGIEIWSVSRSIDVLSLNVSGSSSNSSLSYRRFQRLGSVFEVPSQFISCELGYVPLISAVIGQLTVNC